MSVSPYDDGWLLDAMPRPRFVRVLPALNPELIETLKRWTFEPIAEVVCVDEDGTIRSVSWSPP